MKKTTTEITEKYTSDGKLLERTTKTVTEETAETLNPYATWLTSTGSGSIGLCTSTTTALL